MYAGVKNQTPGVGDLYENVENEISFGDPAHVNFFRFGVLVGGASRDDSHTANTSVLRPGLLMGYHVANKEWIPYDSANAANAGDTIKGVFYMPVDMQLNGADVDRWGGYILRPGAPLKVGSLYTNDGTAGAVVGHAAEAAIRTALEGLGYKLDDWYQN